MKIDDVGVLKQLYQAVRQMNQATRLEEVLQVGLETAVSLVHSERGFIVVQDAWLASTFNYIASHNIDKSVIEEQFIPLPQALSNEQTQNLSTIFISLKPVVAMGGRLYLERESGNPFSSEVMTLLQEVVNLLEREFTLHKLRFFALAMPYELRTPLSMLKGYSDLLLSTTEEPLNEKQKAYATTINVHAEKLMALVDESRLYRK